MVASRWGSGLRRNWCSGWIFMDFHYQMKSVSGCVEQTGLVWSGRAFFLFAASPSGIIERCCTFFKPTIWGEGEPFYAWQLYAKRSSWIGEGRLASRINVNKSFWMTARMSTSKIWEPTSEDRMSPLYFSLSPPPKVEPVVGAPLKKCRRKILASLRGLLYKKKGSDPFWQISFYYSLKLAPSTYSQTSREFAPVFLLSSQYSLQACLPWNSLTLSQIVVMM